MATFRGALFEEDPPADMMRLSTCNLLFQRLNQAIQMTACDAKQGQDAGAFTLFF